MSRAIKVRAARCRKKIGTLAQAAARDGRLCRSSEDGRHVVCQAGNQTGPRPVDCSRQRHFRTYVVLW